MRRKEYCQDCGIEVLPYNHVQRCRSCNIKYLWKKGILGTESHIKNISKGGKGKVRSEDFKHRVSETLKQQCKEGKHFIPDNTGDKHWNWQGGKSLEPYGKEFNMGLKERVRKRDNYTCQECNQTQKQLGYRLCIHHIDFNKNNNKVNNLIALCRSCHTKIRFGKQDWIEYYKNKVDCKI